MRAINYLEIKNLALRLEELEGAQLQNLRTGIDLIELEFYHKGQSWFLLIDLKPNNCFSFLTQTKLEKKYVASTTPMLLFLRAHAIGRRLLKVEQSLQNDRRLIFHLSPIELPCRIEVVLYTPYQNFIVELADKKMSWNKVKEETRTSTYVLKEEDKEISTEVSTDTWKKARFSIKSVQAQDPVQLLKKNIEKKEKALEKVMQDIKEKQVQYQNLIQAGNLLKLNLYKKLHELPEELRAFIEDKKTLAQNMEQIFEKAKSLKEKLEGSQVRMKELQKEIEALKNTDPLALVNKKEKDKSLKVSEVQSRSLSLDSGAVAYLGKSAADNLKILRQAKSWDLWMHLRDYPSAHVIIRRHRNQNISQGELEKVARWFCKESLQAKRELREGDRVEFIVTEVRFVRPLKGAPGLVHYESEKSFVIRY